MLIIVIIVILLVFFIAMLFIKPKCPDCDGKMDDVNIHDGHIVYKCRDCGKEWI